MERKEIPVSTGIKALAAGAAVFPAVAVIVGVYAEGFTSFVGWAGAVMSGALVLVAAPSLFQSGPALIVDDSGVTDHTPLLGVGLIPWPQIQELGLTQSSGRWYLLLGVGNAEPYLAKVWWLKRIIARMHRCGPRIPIDLGSLAGDREALCRMIAEQAAACGAPAAAPSDSSAHAAPPPSQGPAPVPPPAATASPQTPAQVTPRSAGPSPEDLAALEALVALRDKGVLTDEELNAKKKQILGL